MASATLVATSVNSATGWSGATAADLADNDGGFEATDGVAGELINIEITNVPGDFDTSNHVNLTARWNISGSASRAKNLLLELLDSGDSLIESATFTTSSLSSPADTTSTSGNLSISQTAATLNGARMRLTVEEGGGMGDSVTVSVDYMEVLLDYNPTAASYTITGDVTVTSTIAATLDYTRNASITGAVTVTSTIASTMEFTLNAAITGAVTIPLTIASGMQYSTGANEIVGDVTITPTITSAMNIGREINGQISIVASIAGGMAYNTHDIINGDTTIVATIASGMDYTYTAELNGALFVPITIAGGMLYTAADSGSDGWRRRRHSVIAIQRRTGW